MRKKLKRLLAGILSVMLVMGMTEIPAKKVEAAGAPEFTARFTDADGKTITTANPGDEVQVVLSVKNAGKMSGFDVRVSKSEKSDVLQVQKSTKTISDTFNAYWNSLSDDVYSKQKMINTKFSDGKGLLAVICGITQQADFEDEEIPGIQDMDIATVKVKVADDYIGKIDINTYLDEYTENGSSNGIEAHATTTATLNVKEQEIPATAIKLDKNTMSLDLSGTTTGKLTASYEPENTTDKGNTVTWKSDKESVATVDKEGNVTAVGKGTANITASIVNAEGKTLTSNVCKVTVSKSVKSVTLDQTEVGLKQGQKKTLKATVTPRC